MGMPIHRRYNHARRLAKVLRLQLFYSSLVSLCGLNFPGVPSAAERGHAAPLPLSGPVTDSGLLTAFHPLWETSCFLLWYSLTPSPPVKDSS